MGLVLSWWSLLKKIDFAAGSGLQHLQKAMWGAYKEVQQSICFISHSRLGQPARYTDQLDFKCDISSSLLYYIYLITHNIIRKLFKRKP